MSTYMLRNMDAQTLAAFRERCRAVGVTPQQALKAVVTGARLSYDIAADLARLSVSLPPQANQPEAQ